MQMKVDVMSDKTLSLYTLPPLPINDRNSDTALHLAALKGDLSHIYQLLESGYSVHSVDEFGHTPLDLAIHYQQTEAACLLVKQSDLINHGVRPLLLALNTKNEAIAKAIIQHSQFDGDLVAFRAFNLKQVDVLNFLVSHQVAMPMTKTLLTAKMLAHRFSLAGEMNIYPEGKPLPVSLEGHFNQMTAVESFLSFQAYVDYLKKQPELPQYFEAYTHTLEALRFAATSYNSANAYMDKFYENHLSSPSPLFVPSGWDGHAVGIVIFGDTLYKCNRGEGSDSIHGIVAYKIGNFQGFDEALFDKRLAGNGSSYFLQSELDEILALTEIGRYEAPPQTVGNCAWFSAIESIHAILIAEFTMLTNDPLQGESLAHTVYEDWQNFDLNNSIQHLQEIGSTKEQQDMISDVLCKILFSQHDANDPNHIDRALYILNHVDNPADLLKSLDDPAFHQSVSKAIEGYIDIYQHSHWYDYGYFWLDSYLDMFNLGYTNQTYEEYSSAVNLGKSLGELVIQYPDILYPTEISTNNDMTHPLKWEDIFGSHGVCADKPTNIVEISYSSNSFQAEASSPNNSLLPASATTDLIAPLIESPEFAKILI